MNSRSASARRLPTSLRMLWLALILSLTLYAQAAALDPQHEAHEQPDASISCCPGRRIHSQRSHGRAQVIGALPVMAYFRPFPLTRGEKRVDRFLRLGLRNRRHLDGILGPGKRRLWRRR